MLIYFCIQSPPSPKRDVMPAIAYHDEMGRQRQGGWDGTQAASRPPATRDEPNLSKIVSRRSCMRGPLIGARVGFTCRRPLPRHFNRPRQSVSCLAADQCRSARDQQGIRPLPWATHLQSHKLRAFTRLDPLGDLSRQRSRRPDDNHLLFKSPVAA